jgi:hypothetical protein
MGSKIHPAWAVCHALTILGLDVGFYVLVVGIDFDFLPRRQFGAFCRRGPRARQLHHMTQLRRGLVLLSVR